GLLPPALLHYSSTSLFSTFLPARPSHSHSHSTSTTFTLDTLDFAFIAGRYFTDPILTTMSSSSNVSAVAHVVAYLTNPLRSMQTIPHTCITSAQVILTASLSGTRAPCTTLTLTLATPPPAVFAASIGSNIPWAVWFAALGGQADETVSIVFGPRFVKARVGNGAVVDVWRWSLSNGGSVPQQQPQKKAIKVATAEDEQPTLLRLRATLFAARMRTMRRQPVNDDAASSSSSSSSSSDSESDFSDSESDTASSVTSYRISSPVEKPAPATVRPTFARRLPAPSAAVQQRSAKPTPKVSYLYQGGVTRVMTGGVMLGGARS
ncbi:unnamed protein product, partial [Mycena citricolor]